MLVCRAMAGRKANAYLDQLAGVCDGGFLTDLLHDSGLGVGGGDVEGVHGGREGAMRASKEGGVNGCLAGRQRRVWLEQKFRHSCELSMMLAKRARAWQRAAGRERAAEQDRTARTSQASRPSSAPPRSL